MAIFSENLQELLSGWGFAPSGYSQNGQNVIQMAIFSEKLQELLCNLDFSNSENMQNVVQMALKWLFFSEKLQELPSGWGPYSQAPIGVNCYLARNLHNQQLPKFFLQV